MKHCGDLYPSNDSLRGQVYPQCFIAGLQCFIAGSLFFNRRITATSGYDLVAGNRSLSTGGCGPVSIYIYIYICVCTLVCTCFLIYSYLLTSISYFFNEIIQAYDRLDASFRRRCISYKGVESLTLETSSITLRQTVHTPL